MESKLQPKFARVLIRRERFASKTGGIIIPSDIAKRNAPSKGVVVAVGPACDEQIRPGMTVIMGQYAGAWINAEGALIPREDMKGEAEDFEFFVCQDEDIIAEVKE